MSEEDDAAYRRRIVDSLIRNGFEWVVQEVDAQIADGKVSAKSVIEQERFLTQLDPMFTVRKPRRRQASLITSEPYSESERLDILLNAIKAAIVERVQIEVAILDQLPEISAVEFEPDAPTEEVDLGFRGAAHRINRASMTPDRSLQERAEHVLTALRSR
jgi:hypothetical protein